jgi:hypothetical protein
LLKDVVARVAERSGVMGLLKDVVARVVAERSGVMGLLKGVVARVAERSGNKVCSRMWYGFAQGRGGKGC